jgi:hypothetical protein
MVAGGLAIALTLAVGVFAFTLVGGIGLEQALRRATRAGLLVLVATWLRAAAGTSGLREVSRRTLGRLRWVPSVREATLILDQLGAGREIGAAARSVRDRLRPVPKRPQPIVDAVLGWVAAESNRFRPSSPVPAPRLSARTLDFILVVLAATPAIALVAS